MREIKFRFWNKKLRTMQYPFDTTCFDFKADPLDVNDKLWVLKVYADECEAMQYTGLKDKSGKEIYESDLVKNKAGEVYEVKWGNDDSDGGYIAGFSFGYDYWPELEVIGDIYTTPELLTNN